MKQLLKNIFPKFLQSLTPQKTQPSHHIWGDQISHFWQWNANVRGSILKTFDCIYNN